MAIFSKYCGFMYQFIFIPVEKSTSDFGEWLQRVFSCVGIRLGRKSHSSVLCSIVLFGK